MFSGHALDEMQSQGIMPSAFKDAIDNGTKRAGRDNTNIIHSVEKNLGFLTDNLTDIL